MSRETLPGQPHCRHDTSRRWTLGRFRLITRSLLSIALFVSSAHSQARPGDNERALQVTRVVDELQRTSRLGDALQFLDVALSELRAGPEMTAVLHIRRAETRRVLFDLEGMNFDLDQAEILLVGTLDEDLMLCNVHGIRGDAALDQGLLGLAARHFSSERTLVEQERSVRGEGFIEWFHANLRTSRLMLAREDYVDLETTVARWLDLPVYAQPSAAGHAAQLRLRLALGLREVEQNDPTRQLTAEEMFKDVLGKVPPSDRPGALLRLAELRLRQRDLPGARDWLRKAAKELSANAPTNTHSLRVEPMLLVALQARTERLAGATQDVLAQHTAALDEQLARFAASWQARPKRTGGYGPLQYGPILTLIGERIAMHLIDGESEEHLAAALTDVMRVAAQGSLARSLGATVPDLPEIRRQVLRHHPQHGVLIYLPTPWMTHLFLLDSSTIRHFELARDDVLEKTRRDLIRNLVAPPSHSRQARHESLCQEMSELLFPVEAWETLRKWTRWSTVGTDVLGEVPLEMLPTDEGDPIGARFAVDRVLSLPVAVALATQRDEALSTGTVTVLVADEPSEEARELSPGLTPFPGDDRTFETLLVSYPSTQRRFLSGHAANFASLSDDSRPDTQKVWQIIAHGVTDTSRELAVGLALAPNSKDDDGLIWVQRLETSTPPPLVILTACNAGAAPLRRGDPGAAGLAGALLAAGARTVIASPYDLELGAVVKISSRLHEALAEGASPAESMRRARASMTQEQSSSTAAPWDGLQVIGLGHLPVLPPPSPESPMPWGLLGGAVVTLAAIAGYAWRRRCA